MNYKILYSVILLVLASGTFVWANHQENDDVIIETHISTAFYRNYTVPALTSNMRFEINVTEEGIETLDYVPVVMPVVTNQNEIELSFIPARRDFENRDKFFWFMSNSAAVSRNVTLEIVILGAMRE